MNSSIAIAPLLIVFLMLVGLVVGIILWITGGRSKGTGEMSCGGCGYAVRGLNALNCPECGADLRMVGINRPKGGTARIVGMVLTIGIGLLLLTCMGSVLFWAGSSNSSMQSSPTVIIPNSGLNQSTIAQPLQADPPELEIDEPATNESSETEVPSP